jgi:hypothetical protein
LTEVEITLQEAAKFLPPFLAEAELRALYDQLKRLDKLPYFSSQEIEYKLQGDTFAKAPFVIVRAESASLRRTTVMLLSNTCDIAEDNTRRFPVNVTVAPVVRVSKWREIALDAGVGEATIDAMLHSARLHRISNLFYIPAGRQLQEESLVIFDRIQSIPIADFGAANPERLATLSQAAFWLLLLKLSVHFCRQQEGVRRGWENA